MSPEGEARAERAERERLAQELEEGVLDPDEAPAGLEPWDEGADDER